MTVTDRTPEPHHYGPVFSRCPRVNPRMDYGISHDLSRVNCPGCLRLIGEPGAAPERG